MLIASDYPTRQGREGKKDTMAKVFAPEILLMDGVFHLAVISRADKNLGPPNDVRCQDGMA
jgi:hypothetical protein